MARDNLVTLLARSSPPFKLPLSELSHVPGCTPSVLLELHILFDAIKYRYSAKGCLTIGAYYESLDRWISWSSNKPGFSGSGLIAFIVLHLLNRRWQESGLNEGLHPPTRDGLGVDDDWPEQSDSHVACIASGGFAAPHCSLWPLHSARRSQSLSFLLLNKEQFTDI